VINSDANNGVWISPTGILAKQAGSTTLTIPISGSPTFKGTILADSVVSCDISCDRLTSGTITGQTFRTAAPAAGVGSSVVITGGTNQAITLYHNADLRATIKGFTTEGDQVTYLSLVAASGRYIKLKNSYTEFDGDLATQKIYPRDDNEYELGDLNKRWSKGHFEDIDVDDLHVFVSIDVPGINEKNLLSEAQKSLYSSLRNREVTDEEIEKFKKGNKVGKLEALHELKQIKRKEDKEANITGFEIGDVLVWGNGQLALCDEDASTFVVAIGSHRGMPCVMGAEPVKVIGKVEQGDFLVTSTTEGHARAEKNPTIGTVIAQALESKKTEGEGKIKAMIQKF
jgi:hypothetical protein